MEVSDSKSWLEHQYLSSDGSDLDLLVMDSNEIEVRIPAHSFVLCAQSPKFKTILNSMQFQERREILMIEMEPQTVAYFLRWFYIKEFPINIHQKCLLELFKAASEFEMGGLMAVCERRLKGLFYYDICKIYESAISLNRNDLKVSCEVIIKEQLSEIIENDLHYYLSENNFKSMFTNVGKAEINGLKRLRNYHMCLEGKRIEKGPNEDSPYSSTLDWVDNLYMDSKSSDVELLVMDNPKARFPAHSFILKEQSEVFRDLLENAENENRNDGCRQITLHRGITCRIADYMLRFIYTRFLPKKITKMNLLDILKAAHQYKLKALILKCVTILSPNEISALNCCQILVISQQQRVPELYNLSLASATMNLDVLLQNLHIFNLDQEQLLKVFRNVTKITQSEQKLINVLKEWAKWRCCFERMSQDNLSEMVDPILSIAKRKIII